MLELLTQLNTKSSSLPDNQVDFGSTSQLCPACSSRSRKAVADEGDCPRCGGTRRLAETGNQNQTRGTSDVLKTPQYVASLLAGTSGDNNRKLAEHKIWAALVFVNDDIPAAQKLMAYMIDNVIKVAAADWRLDEETRRQRITGLAATSVLDLANYPHRLDTQYACAIVGCKATQWRTLWKDRSEVFFSRQYGWVFDVNAHMKERHDGPSKGKGRSAA